MYSLELTSKQKELYELAKKDVAEYQKKGLYPKIDMHIHTDMSDGLFSIPHVIKMAKEFGLKEIYITDHNTCLPGYEVLKSLSDEFIGDLEVHVGCEIASKIEDIKTGKFISIEILSYFADPKKIQDFLNKYDFANNISQEEQLKTLLNTCDKLGLIYSQGITIPDGSYATEVLCRDLIKHEHNKDYFMTNAPKVWTDPKLFFKMCVSNPDSDFYLDNTAGFPYYVDTIHAINQAGGFAIVAHPFLYSRNTPEEVKQLMDKIVSTTNIHGLEAIHSSHNEEQRNFIKDYAYKNNLFYTGGTDFHSGSKTILGYGQKQCPVALQESGVLIF